ncbi:ABC transporter permease [Galactobacter sp.]|mgnify:CR=1 FL=1|uniref:ABC transporter permease n=1 Tax=Galactobacter sp. TaxID=2676125 RepID=UPI0025B984CD|nr:ABC transporter permease [Galactobacter sp.]
MNTQHTITDPSTRPAWVIVALRELTDAVKRKSFLITTAAFVVVIAVGVSLFGYLSQRVSTETVAVSSQSEAAVVEGAQNIAKTTDAKKHFKADVVDDPRAAVEAKDADLALLAESDGWTLIGRTSISSTSQGILSQAAEHTTVQERAGAAGTSWEDLTDGAQVTPELLEGDSERQNMSFAVGYVFSLLFYLAAILFGMPIGAAVVQEKTSRVVEILAATIPLRHLLAGKIVSATALALGQLALYVATGLVALSLSPADLGFMSVILSSSGWFLVFFVTGFLIVAAVYAALGAMAQKAEDLQSSQTPIMVLLMITLFAGMLAKDLWLVIASYVPIVSSVAMPVRMLQTDVPLWETLVSLGLSVATALVLIRVGGKIFRLAVLNTSGALGFKKALALKD